MNPLPFAGAPSPGRVWQGPRGSPRSQSAVIEGSPEPRPRAFPDEHPWNLQAISRVLSFGRC